MGWLRQVWMRVVPIMLIGMLFGALAPQGFMPRVGENGLSIILCSGSGDVEARIGKADPLYAKIAAIKAAMADDADRHDGNDEQATMPHCAFAGAAMAALLPAQPVVALPQSFAALAPETITTIGLSRHRAATPPATGPPLLI
ncbi:DUF2946 family protein [Rhizorhabdus sp. FW153]